MSPRCIIPPTSMSFGGGGYTFCFLVAASHRFSGSNDKQWHHVRLKLAQHSKWKKGRQTDLCVPDHYHGPPISCPSSAVIPLRRPDSHQMIVSYPLCLILMVQPLACSKQDISTFDQDVLCYPLTYTALQSWCSISGS